jgi:hypothetical protein
MASLVVEFGLVDILGGDKLAAVYFSFAVDLICDRTNNFRSNRYLYGVRK